MHYFFFLNLIITLNVLGALTYAGLELKPNVLSSIISPVQTPDLRGFSDKKMEKIFQEIAENHPTKDSNPFFERIEQDAIQTKEFDPIFDMACLRYLTLDNRVTTLPDVSQLLYNHFIKGKPCDARSNFNNLLSSLHQLGIITDQNDEISFQQKQALLESLSQKAWGSYSTILENNEMSLKDALVKRIEYENPTIISWLNMKFWNALNFLTGSN